MGVQISPVKLFWQFWGLGVLVLLVLPGSNGQPTAPLYPPSGWVADLTARPASVEPTGFRPLPLGGFIFNAQASGDAVARHLFLFRNGVAAPFRSGFLREEPKYYFPQSDTIGNYLYFINSKDHQIYRTMGRNTSDVELVNITWPPMKSNLFVFDNQLVFEGLLLAGETLGREGILWRWIPDVSSTAIDFGATSSAMTSLCSGHRCEVASYATAKDYLIISRRSTANADLFRTMFTRSPGFGPPEDFSITEDNQTPVLEAYVMRDAVCAAKRVRLLCEGAGTLHAKAWQYSGPAIPINDTHILMHYAQTTDLVTQIFTITNEVMTLNAHLYQPETSYAVPAGATTLCDNEGVILRTGRWARLSPTVFLSHWPTTNPSINLMRTFDISTGTYGTVPFPTQVDQFEIIGTEPYYTTSNMGQSNTTYYFAYVAARSVLGLWSIYRISQPPGAPSAILQQIPAPFVAPLSSPIASATVVDNAANSSLLYFAANTTFAGVNQLVSWNTSSWTQLKEIRVQYGTQGSTSAEDPKIQVWPFRPPNNESQLGLVEHAAAIVRTYDDITREFKLTLITGWTHPDDRCDISTELIGQETFNYARDVVEVVTSTNHAVLVIYPQGKPFPMRKIVARSCAPRVAFAIQPLVQIADRADRNFVSDVWCGDVLFFKEYDSSRSDFRVSSFHDEAGYGSRSIQRGDTAIYPQSIMDQRVVITCLQPRLALASFPSSERLRFVSFDRRRIYNPSSNYVDDDSDVRDQLTSNPTFRPVEWVGRLNNVLIYTNNANQIYGLRMGSNPIIINPNYTMVYKPYWVYLPRSHPARWITVKTNSAWFYNDDDHILYRVTVNDAESRMRVQPAVDPHLQPYISQSLRAPDDFGLVFVAPFGTTEFYTCPHYFIQDECWEAAYTQPGAQVRFMYTINNTLYWSEGSTTYDEQGSIIRSVYMANVSFPATWPNVEQRSISSLIPWAYGTVFMPDYSSSLWESNGVRIMLLRTAFGVELVAFGNSRTPPLPADIGITSPLTYPIRIPPVPSCSGLPPQVDFICIDGTWTYYGSKNITSQTIPIIGNVALKGNLTVSNVTFTVGPQGFLNVSECIDFSQGPLNLNLSVADLSNPNNAANGIRFGETLSSCVSSYPQSFSLSPQESTCETYSGQLQYGNSTSDRVSLSVVFTVNTLQCQIWWIALAASLGGAVILAVAIAVIAIKCCRKKIMPFSQRRE